MLLLFVIVGLILGLIRGGSLKNINNNFPEKLLLPILALLIEFLFSLDPVYPEWMVVPIEYMLLFWFVACNLKKAAWSIWFGIGTLLNFLVISMNDFRMPVSASLLNNNKYLNISTALSNGEIFGYTIADTNTHLTFLGDIMAFSPFGKLIGFASVGDIFLGIGTAFLAYHMVKSNIKK
ncbi:MAG: DUF5317 family protein [Anaerovoracaceae bacterium]|jgi:hypothetical protein